MGEQAGGSSADEEARVAASSQPLRRSKRDSATRRKSSSPRSAGAEVTTAAEASAAAPRRSQRHGAPASPAAAPVTPSASKTTPTSAAAARGPAVEPMTLLAVATQPSQSKRRPVNRPELRAPSGGCSAAHANSAVTVMGDASVTVRTQLRKVLGRYTARECSLVCESILEHLKRQSNLSTALESEISPAHMDWRAIAALIETTHRMIISPRDCQDLWKFLAYAQTPDEAERAEDELLASSDDEQYDWTVEEIQQRHVNAVKNAATPAQVPSIGDAIAPTAGDDDAAPQVLPATAEAPLEETTPTQTTDLSDSSEAVEPTVPTEAIKTEQDTPSFPTEDTVASAAESTTATSVPSTVRLHPTYELPTGAPAGWEHPFQPKTMQPLTFVAEKFLKRKPYPTPMPQTPLVPATAASPAVAAAPSPIVPPANSAQATLNPVLAPAPAPAPTPVPVSAPIALTEQVTPATEASDRASNEPALKKHKQEAIAPAPTEAGGPAQAPSTS